VKRLVPAVVLALAALVAPAPSGAHTAGNVSACADAFSGGSGGCGFEYAGVRVLAWAIAAPGTSAVTVEARYQYAPGQSSLIAECTVSGGNPVCYAEPLSKPVTPNFQKLQCVARGTGTAVFGCLSQKPIL
jgi:hypothetical protein